MRAHGSKFGVKMRPPNRQKLKKVVGKIEIFLAQNPIFFAQNLIFFNGFPISENSEKIFFKGFPTSSTAFRSLQRISNFCLNGFQIFLNGFPLSKKSGKINLPGQIYKRLLSKIRISRSKSRYSAIK